MAYFYLNTHNNIWNVIKKDGIFELDGKQNQVAELGEGNKIVTKKNSNVEIINNNSSRIFLKANSILVLKEIGRNFKSFFYALVFLY